MRQSSSVVHIHLFDWSAEQICMSMFARFCFRDSDCLMSAKLATDCLIGWKLMCPRPSLMASEPMIEWHCRQCCSILLKTVTISLYLCSANRNLTQKNQNNVTHKQQQNQMQMIHSDQSEANFTTCMSIHTCEITWQTVDPVCQFQSCWIYKQWSPHVLLQRLSAPCPSKWSQTDSHLSHHIT